MTNSPLPTAYRDVAWLGAGAFGQVYRAVDAEGRAVAVKTLDPALASQPEQAWQFRSEYRRLARLDHPAFPPAYEEGLLPSGEPYYAMALAAGQPPVGPIGAAALRQVLAGVAEALAYLHGAGLVHGDLKPDNLLVRDDGAVSVLDVGLMAPVGAARPAIAGTLTYMAPEVLRRAPAAPAADLYALGAIAYELAAGRPPFTGTPAEQVSAHLQSPPPPLPAGEVAADRALAALILRLLDKAPARRPASAEAVLAALAGRPEPAARRTLLEGPWLGREAVTEAWQAVLAGGGWLRLTGAAGSGKSRALDELRLAAEMAGRTWIGLGAGGDAPAGPVRALVRQALAAAGQSPSPTLAAWLGGSLPAELQALEPAARRLVIQTEVASALEGVEALAIGLDDWHAADEASRELVAQLQKRPSGKAIAWAIAEAEAAPEALALAPLTDAEVETWLTERLGGPPPAALVAYLGPAAQGNPGLLTLLLDHAVASGQLVGDAEGWRFQETAAGLPRSAAAVWQSRLAPLSPEARQLAVVVAAGAPAGALPVPVVLAAADSQAPDAFEPLVAAGLVTIAHGEVRLAVAGAAEALLADVSAVDRAAWARRLAQEVLQAEPLAALPLEALIRGARLAIAGDDSAQALTAAIEAGRRTLGLSMAKDALFFLDAAAERMPPDAPEDLRRELALSRAEAERLADRLDDAATDYTLAATLAEGGGRRSEAARAWIGLGKCRQMKGDYPGALEAYAAAAAQAEGVDAPQQARALTSEARVRVFQGDSAAAIARCEAAVALARGADDRPSLAAALNLLGVLRVQATPESPEPGLAMLQEALALSQAVGDRLGAGTALENLGNAHLALGDLLRAGESFGGYVAILEEAGQATDALGARFNQAIVAGERGALTLAVAVAGDVAALATQVGRKFPLAAAQTVLGQAAWRQGRPHDAPPAFELALATATALGNKYLEEHVRLYRLEAWLALGRTEDADAETAALTALVAATDHAEARAHLACCAAERRLLEGDAEGAMGALAEQVDAANRVIAHRARRAFVRSALALGAPEEAVAMARSALAIAEGWEAPWHVAADRWLLARALLAAGDRGEALALARTVLEADGPDPNPYARAGAAQLLTEFGTRADDRSAAEAGGAALRAALEALDPAEAQSLLAAQDLQGPGHAAARPAGAEAIDAQAFSQGLTRIALERGEEAIMQAALEVAIALVGADRGYLLAYDEGRLSRVITAALDYEAEVQAHFSRSIAEHVLFSGEPVYVMDASADAEWSASRSVAALALKTVVCLPVASGEDVLGVLYMDREAFEPVLTPSDMTVLTALTTFAAAGVFQARSQARARRAEVVADWALALAAGQEAAAIERALVAGAIMAAGADRGFLLVRSAEGPFVARLGLDAAGGELGEATVSQGVAERVYERQEALTVLDASSDAEWEARRSVQALGLRTIWCVPLSGREQLLYLDTAQLTQADPTETLRDVRALVERALPLLSG